MKKTLVTMAVLGLMAGCCSLTTQAVNAVGTERGYISVNTNANTEVAPDVVEISFATVRCFTISFKSPEHCLRPYYFNIYLSLELRYISAKKRRSKT